MKCIAELRLGRDVTTFFTDAQTNCNKQGLCVCVCVCVWVCECVRQQQNAVWVSVLGGAVSSWRWDSWEILSFAVHVDSTTEVHACPKSYTFVALNVDSTLEATHRSKILSNFSVRIDITPKINTGPKCAFVAVRAGGTPRLILSHFVVLQYSYKITTITRQTQLSLINGTLRC